MLSLIKLGHLCLPVFVREISSGFNGYVEKVCKAVK